MSKELIQCAKLINKMDLQMTNMAKKIKNLLFI